MSGDTLLSRYLFRTGVFERDNHTCVFCDNPAKDAHHILERRLWQDGGYYLDNGASVCEEHHILCEETNISVEDIRLACGITKKILPDHLYPDQPYDKWGNPILDNGMRAKGELFFDESVQKILKQGGVLHLFSNYIKYPRTYHLPWSGNINSDDRVIQSLECFKDKNIVVTLKMDGENTSMYSDYYHARSVDSKNHPSRNMVKRIWGDIGYNIPEGWRVCGENMYAKHSISYNNLPSYFLGFSIWNDRNVCLSWNETLEWFQLLGITPVPVLYTGIFNEEKLKEISHSLNTEKDEGFVVRLSSDIDYRNFKYEVAKWVRPNHVQTVKHWMRGQKIIPNTLQKDEN